MNYNTEATIQGIGQLHFSGHIIHHTWFSHIKFESGKPDLVAIMILADIVYWYRPSEVKNEYSGELQGFKKKFKADMLQRSSRSYAKLYGISQRQASDAIRRLCERGLIIREYRNIETHELTLSNVQFLAPIVEAIAKIQIPTPILSDDSDNPTDDEYFIPLMPVNPSPSSFLQNNDSTSKAINAILKLNEKPAIAYCAYAKDNTENTTQTASENEFAVFQSTAKMTTPNITAENALIKQKQKLSHDSENLVIGKTLTESQKEMIKLKVSQLFSQKFTQTPEQLIEEIQLTLLSKKYFTESQQDFQKKLNTICKMIRENKWATPIDWVVNQTKIKMQEIQNKNQKWRELQLEHQHWSKILNFSEQSNNSKHLDSLKKLVQFSYKKLCEFHQENKIQSPIPHVFSVGG